MTFQDAFIIHMVISTIAAILAYKTVKQENDHWLILATLAPIFNLYIIYDEIRAQLK